MKKGIRLLMGILLILLVTACKAAPVSKTEPLPESGVYWTVETEQGNVALRSGGTDHMSLFLQKDGEETLLKTLQKEEDYHEPWDVTAWAFTDTLGYDGFALRTAAAGGSFGTNVYYAIEGDQLEPIADSFGFEVEDTAVDLDADGQTELAANNTYGGDGHRMATVFRRTNEGIEKGVLALPEIPDHDNWGVNSYMSEYDPIEAVFRITYNVKGSEESNFIETAGLEWFTFAPYEAG